MHTALPLLIAGVLTTVSCASLEPSKDSQPPAYTSTSSNFRSFVNAEALARYLRADSRAGPLVIAHRGGATFAYPENALATFRRALRYGPALIELDIQMARDQTYVILRDETLDRTTTGTGRVADQSLTDLRRLLLVDELGIITPFPIPTLDEVLAWSAGRTILMLDIKADIPIAGVLEAIQRHDASGRVIVMATSLPQALDVYQNAPDLVIAVPAADREELEAVLASQLDTTRLIVLSGLAEVNPEVVELAHTHRMRVVLGTVGLIDRRALEGGIAVYQSLVDRGVDMFVTDNVKMTSEAVAPYLPDSGQ